MMLIDCLLRRGTFARLSSLIFLALAATACSDDAAPDDRPVVVINPGDASTQGCIQPSFPAEEPDLSALQPPRFLTENTNGQAQIDPGGTAEAEITVDGETRFALVELLDTSGLVDPIAVQEVSTPGNQTLDLIFFTDIGTRFGRYYLRISLCGFDCDERTVVFDLNPDVNAPYERTVIENGEVVSVETTCVDVFPRATLVIQ